MKKWLGPVLFLLGIGGVLVFTVVTAPWWIREGRRLNRVRRYAETDPDSPSGSILGRLEKRVEK